MEQKSPRARMLWRVLLPVEAAIFALFALLRLTNVFTFRMAYVPMLFLLFFAADAVLFLCFYDRRHRGEPAYRAKRRLLLLLLLIAVLASAPLATNYLVNGHDIQFHLFRIEGVRDGLAEGQLPVRIHPNTLNGFGYANPEFYPELLLYFPALLRLSGFSIMAAYKTFLFALNLLTAIFSYYACARIFRSVKLGLVGSAFYTLSLYRLVNLYTRAAIGEASAMTFLPLVAVGIYAILLDDPDTPAYRRAFLPLLVGMTGLISSHLLTCEIVLPLLLVCCLVFLRRALMGKRLLALAVAACGTALLSLAFIVPMLDYMGYDEYLVFGYSTANLGNEAVNVAQLFPLLPNAVGESNAAYMGARNEMPLGVGFACLPMLMLYPFLRARQPSAAQPARDHGRMRSFCYFGALALLFMSTNLFPWNALYNAGGGIAKVAGLMQFPWRLLSLATLLLTFVACDFAALLPTLPGAPLRRAVACALCLLFIITTASYCDRLIQDSPALVIHTSADLDQRRSVGDAEYLPVGTSGVNAYRGGEPVNAGKDLAIADFVRDGTTVTFAVTNAGDAAQTVDLPLINYLGYRAADGAGNALAIAKGEDGRIRVTIPAGYNGTVSVRFAERPLWRAAEAVTLITAMLLLAWYIVQRRKYGAPSYADDSPIVMFA